MGAERNTFKRRHATPNAVGASNTKSCTFPRMDTLASRLAQARQEAGLSQPELVAELQQRFPDAKLSQQTYSRLETGKYKSTAAILELAQVLQVRAEWLRWGTGPQRGIEHAEGPRATLLRLMEAVPDYQVARVIKIVSASIEPDNEGRTDKVVNGN
jgi:transcriptional regulator with XRE-family HTH domain